MLLDHTRHGKQNESILDCFPCLFYFSSVPFLTLRSEIKVKKNTNYRKIKEGSVVISRKSLSTEVKRSECLNFEERREGK